MNRRHFLALGAAALPLADNMAAAAASPDLFVCMHEITSLGFDFRTAMEGYARAGIRAVEPHLDKVREFAAHESPAAARRLLDDLGLTPVSCSNQLFLEETGPRRAGALEELKWKLDLMQAIGADRLVMPSAAMEGHEAGVYGEVIDNLREAADIAAPYGVTLMLEHTRRSTLVNNLRTALMLVRTADHPCLRVMLDTWHFWSGMSKFEDLELLRTGELHHLHLQDVPAEPPLELLGHGDRVFPGAGIAPLGRIIEVLRRKGYRGPASLELPDPVIQNTDPYEVARKARRAMEPLLV